MLWEDGTRMDWKCAQPPRRHFPKQHLVRSRKLLEFKKTRHITKIVVVEFLPLRIWQCLKLVKNLYSARVLRVFTFIFKVSWGSLMFLKKNNKTIRSSKPTSTFQRDQKHCQQLLKLYKKLKAIFPHLTAFGSFQPYFITVIKYYFINQKPAVICLLFITQNLAALFLLQIEAAK